MTDDMIRLGMRAVECKGWKWLPGMLYQYREESDEVTVPTKHYWCDPTRVRDNDPDTPACSGGLSVPDLSDPATLGCLLALVREAWAEPSLTVACTGEWWDCDCQRWPSTRCAAFSGLTEAEALVAALESAP
jgi:hypothetical protein